MKRGFVRGREKLRKLLMAVAFIPFVLMIIISSIYAAQFSTTSQGDFDNGTYDFTYYNSTGGYVQLNVSYTKGNYTSKIFESKIIAKWINISWAEDVIPDGPYGTELPDNQTIESTANMTGNVLLMHLNNEYVRKGEIDIKKLFAKDDITSLNCSENPCLLFTSQPVVL